MSGPPSVAFTLSPGQISQPLQSGQNQFVIALREKREPTPEEFAKGKEQERDTLANQKRQQAFELFAENLKETMEKQKKIKYNTDEQKRLLGNKTAFPIG